MRAAAAFAAGVLIAACAPRAVVEDTAAPGPAPPSRPGRLPADALLWEGEPPDGIDPRIQLLEKTGVLVRTAGRSDEDRVRWWPFSMDYWGIRRTDLEPLLASHVGRSVRVRGHFKKIYDHGRWIHEVDPVRIVALAEEPPDPPAPPRNDR